ncbi:MAG: hypothetical protein N3A72_05865 [bacterium]|nr:hypothetical protein [bacterium]
MANNIDQNKLVQLLLEQKLLNKRQLKNALTEQQKTGKSLSQILLDAKLVTRGILADLEAQAMGVEQIHLTEQPLDPAILTLISRRIAEQYRAVPVRLSGDELVVAMENPYDVLAIDDIKLHTNKIIKPVLCSSKDIEYALKQYPDDGTAVPLIVTRHSKITQVIANLIFLLLMFTPLLLLIWLIYASTDIAKWISNYEHLFIVLLWWGFYSIILYWGYGIFFEEQTKTSKTTKSNET